MLVHVSNSQSGVVNLFTTTAITCHLPFTGALFYYVKFAIQCYHTLKGPFNVWSYGKCIYFRSVSFLAVASASSLPTLPGNQIKVKDEPRFPVNGVMSLSVAVVDPPCPDCLRQLENTQNPYSQQIWFYLGVHNNVLLYTTSVLALQCTVLAALDSGMH